jgi:hypothetical protein
MKEQPSTEAIRDDYAELARVRAEVVRALKEEPPNVGALTDALERVDAMLDTAYDELSSALREIRSVRAATGLPTVSPDLAAELLVLRGRDFFPWG